MKVTLSPNPTGTLRDLRPGQCFRRDSDLWMVLKPSEFLNSDPAWIKVVCLSNGMIDGFKPTLVTQVVDAEVRA